MNLQEISANLDAGNRKPIQQKNDKIVDFIRQNCSEALEVYKSNNKVLYKGIKGQPQPTTSQLARPDLAFIARTTTERRPKDIPLKVQQQIDNKLKSAGFTALRSNSIFCSSNRALAQGYTYGSRGRLYIIFPVNGFSCTWSREIEDLFEVAPFDFYDMRNEDPSSLENSQWRAVQDLWDFLGTLDAETTPQDFVEEYGFEKSLKGALDSGNEVLVHGTYVAVSLNKNEVLKELLGW